MFIFKYILIISGLYELSFANLKSCSEPQDEPSKKGTLICFTNETVYSAPLPINLEVEVYFKNVIKIDEDLNLISIQADLWTYWSDPGLALKHGDYLLIDENTARLIWQPKIKFENLLKFEETKFYGDASLYNFLFLGNESHWNMQYGEEFQLTVPCRFHLNKFPFDSHECLIHFLDQRYATFELSINDIEINYGKSSTNVSQDPIILDDLALPFGFDLEALPIKEMYYGGYNVSMAGILIRIKRDTLGLLLSGYYYPTTSFALLSMMSFLINPDVVAGRMGMVVTLYLISANVYNSVDAPKDRGFSYIEIWMIGSQFPILLALLEYGFVLYLKKVVKLSNLDKAKEFEEKIKTLDMTTMIFNFCFFVIFALIYWIVAFTLP